VTGQDINDILVTTTGGRIVVAEDDRFYRRILQKRLETAGHQVIVTTNGQDAWDLIQEDPPEVLLSDWMMPKMDGFEACRTIKRDADMADTPVILLSAKARDIDQKQGYEVGADDYIMKPFSPGRLVDRVHGLLKLKA